MGESDVARGSKKKFSNDQRRLPWAGGMMADDQKEIGFSNVRLCYLVGSTFPPIDHYHSSIGFIVPKDFNLINFFKIYQEM